MAVALVDTNVLIDYRDEDSVRHERAQQIVEGIDRGELPTGSPLGVHHAAYANRFMR